MDEDETLDLQHFTASAWYQPSGNRTFWTAERPLTLRKKSLSRPSHTNSIRFDSIRFDSIRFNVVLAVTSQHKTASEIRSNIKIRPKTSDDFVDITNGFILRQCYLKHSAFLWGHEKSIVPVHDLVQGECNRFRATTFVHFFPMVRLAVSWAVFDYFATTALIHLGQQFGTICAAIIMGVRGGSVVAHHGRQSLFYRCIVPSAKVQCWIWALGFPFFPGESLFAR